MKVFHYCAEVLREVPLFESCNDELLYREANVTQEGSVYNDFDNDRMYLLSDNDDDDDDDEVEELEDEIPSCPYVIGDKDIEKIFLAADEEDYERWSVCHPFFDFQNPCQSTAYINNVYELLHNVEWDDLPIYDDMEYRYNNDIIFLNSFYICMVHAEFVSLRSHSCVVYLY